VRPTALSATASRRVVDVVSRQGEHRRSLATARNGSQLLSLRQLRAAVAASSAPLSPPPTWPPAPPSRTRRRRQYNCAGAALRMRIRTARSPSVARAAHRRCRPRAVTVLRRRTIAASSPIPRSTLLLCGHPLPFSRCQGSQITACSTSTRPQKRTAHEGGAARRIFSMG